MSYKNVGQVALLAGHSVQLSIQWGEIGEDHGAQWFMASGDGTGSALEVSAFTKVKSAVREQISVSYRGTVTNVWQNCVFSIDGGGNT